jgi:lipoic acid synthetase
MAVTDISVVRLGRTSYLDALALQRGLHAQRKAGERGDTLLLTEHEPVLTLGRGADGRNVLADESELAALGIEVVPVERGGDVTYHGPGQLVAYPILDLNRYGRDIHRYVRALEESAIRLLALYGLRGERRAGTPGVWLGDGKIASVGVFVSRWVTLHGIAVNVDPNLSHFELIHPCGLVGQRMTSLAAELGHHAGLNEAIELYVPVLVSLLDDLAVRAAFDGTLPGSYIADRGASLGR